MVTTGVQVPEVPEENEPADEPPTKLVTEQPEAVNLVPVETTPPKVALPDFLGRLHKQFPKKVVADSQTVMDELREERI